jgi:hypothetical protein
MSETCIAHGGNEISILFLARVSRLEYDIKVGLTVRDVRQ